MFSLMENIVTYFNSIKVRLKLGGSALFGGALSFQFHKGTIKTIMITDYYTAVHISIP